MRISRNVRRVRRSRSPETMTAVPAASSQASTWPSSGSRLRIGEEGQALIVRDQSGRGKSRMLDAPGELATTDDLGEFSEQDEAGVQRDGPGAPG